jgi:hypothetical protein
MRTIEKTIRITPSVSTVWGVFTDPAVTIRMGGTYETNWKLEALSAGKDGTERCTQPALF